LNKNEIRSSYLQKRVNVPAEELKAMSLRVQRAFTSTSEFREATSIVLYSGLSNEVATDLIARRVLAGGRPLAYPKVVGHDPPRLAFFRVGSLEHLSLGAYGILEPNAEATEAGEVDVKDFDCIVVPGVAFDVLGNRVGFGKGFYDRRLSTLSNGSHSKASVIVALAYGFQVMKDALPVEPHDVRMDMIVTEKEVLRF
jgi:5-formyltetrahydrofolate cyclo-ligase